MFVGPAFRRWLLLLLLWPATSACAQGLFSSSLSGRVLSPERKPIASARVEVVPEEADAPHSPAPIVVFSNRDGSFIVSGLPEGQYEVHVADPSRPELSAAARVVVEPGEDFAVSLHLLPATQQATANATTPAADTTLSEDRLASLPAVASEWESLQRLSSAANDATVPDVSVAVERDGTADSAERGRPGGQSGAMSPASGLSYRGLPTTQNTESIDGLSAQQSYRAGPRGAAAGGPVSGSTFARSALRSLRTDPRTFSARSGGAGSGLLTVNSRAGSAQVHGGAFLLFRQSAFAATNPYSAVTTYRDGNVTDSLVKPQDTVTQTGGYIGFPLGDFLRVRRLHERLNLFASVEVQVRSNGVVATPANPNFFRLSPTQTALLRNRGVTASAQNAALNYLGDLGGSVDRHSTRGLFFLRADLRAGARDRFAFTYAGNRYTSYSGAGFDRASEAVVARGRASLGDEIVRVDAAAVHWLRTFSPRLHHDLRLQASRDFESEQPHAPLPQEPAIAPGGFAPQVAIAQDGFTYGTPAGLGRGAYPDEHRLQMANTLQLAAGRHLLSLGGDWSRIDDRISQLTNSEGSFLYDSGATNGRAGGLVDWITDQTFSVNAYPNGGCPSIYSTVHLFCFRSFTQSFGGENTRFITHELAGFVEDRLRLREGLVLTAGVRYEYTLLPLPQTPNLSLDAAFAGLGRGATLSFPEDRNNFGPRIAVAWSPLGNRLFTVRVGYGMFFGRLTGATVRAALTQTALPSGTTQVRIAPDVITACPQVANQGFGFPCTYTSAPPAAVAQTSSATVFSPNFSLPAVQRGSLSLERILGKRVSLTAEYNFALTTQLPSSTDINIAPSSLRQTYVLAGGEGYTGLHPGQVFTLPLYTARRVAQYGPVTSLASNANATFHAGALRAELRSFPGLELRGSYTFSRAIDYNPQLSATPRANAQLDPFSNGYDKGLGSLNFPQRFTGELLWRPHLSRSPKLLRHALNGWQIVALAYAGSGAPYSYAIFGGTRLPGGRESLNGSGGANYLPTVGRNTLRLPARGTMDLRLQRGWELGSRAHLTAFAEAFNLLNGRNLSRVETRAFLLGTPGSANAPTPLIFQDAATIAAEGLTARAFGAPVSSTTGLSRERLGELGLRLTF